MDYITSRRVYSTFTLGSRPMLLFTTTKYFLIPVSSVWLRQVFIPMLSQSTQKYPALTKTSQLCHNSDPLQGKQPRSEKVSQNVWYH